MSDPIQPDEPRADDLPAEAADQLTSTPQGLTVEGGPPSADQVKLALRKVKDPELNLNIVDLGLVYEVRVEDSVVEVDMTLTSPGCPAGPQITGDVERAIKALPGVSGVNLQIVWQPFWTPDRIEPRVRAYMGL